MGLCFCRRDRRDPPKTTVWCDLEEVVNKAQEWSNSPWGTGNTLHSAFMSGLFRVLEVLNKKRPNVRRIQLHGWPQEQQSGGSADKRPRYTFRRSEIFHQLWIFAYKPPNLKGYISGFTSYCEKEDDFAAFVGYDGD